MKNKIVVSLAVFLTILLGVTIAPCAVNASQKIDNYGYSKSKDWSYHILSKKNKTVEIRPSYLEKKKNGVSKGKVTIPSSIRIGKSKYTVVRIADCAFSTCMCDVCFGTTSVKKRWQAVKKYGQDNLYSGYNYNRITSVKVPSTVKTIGRYAFAGQKNLAAIDISKCNNLTSIEQYAFTLTKINSIIIPSKVSNLGEYCFWKNKELKIVTFKGNAIKKIGQYVFSETGISSIVLPASCNVLDKYSFACCLKLKTVTFNTTMLEEVSKNAFDGDDIGAFNVKNLKAYNLLKNKFYGDDLLKKAKVICDETKCHIIVDDKKTTIITKKNAIIDVLKYGSFSEGLTASEAYAYGISNLEGEKTSRKKINFSTYRATGYPEEYIEVTTKDIEYELVNLTGYDCISTIEEHFSCDIVRSKENSLCFFDQLVLAPLPEGEEYIKPGYILSGYKIGDSVYYPEEVVSKIHCDEKEKLEVKFYYKPINYLVLYDANGGQPIKFSGNYCVYGVDYSITTEAPNNNMKFVGWNSKKDGSGKYYKSGEVFRNLTTVDDSEVILYAIWSNEKVKITFDPDGGTCNTKEIYKNAGTAVGTLPIPKKSGFKFKGWKYDDGASLTATTKTKSVDTIVRATWEKEKKNVKVTVKLKKKRKSIGYKIYCKVNHKVVYKKSVKKKNVKKVSYTFNNVSYGDELIIKIKQYKKVKVKNKKKNKKNNKKAKTVKKYYKWTVKEVTVR